MRFNSSLLFPASTDAQAFRTDFTINDIRLSHAVLGVIFALSVANYFIIKEREINAPPSGSQIWLLSFLEVKGWYENGQKLIQVATKKFKGKTFKIPRYDGWSVVISSQELIDELRRVPDNVLSFSHAVDEVLATEYTFGGLLTGDHRIITVCQKLTRNIGKLFDDILEEIIQGFTDFIDAKGEEWVTRSAEQVVAKVTFRVSNRIFVGAPLCRNDEFMAINVQHAFDIINISKVVRRCPPLLRSFVARFKSNLPSLSRRASILLRPIIEERLSHAVNSDDWLDKPNDPLQWFIDETGPSDLNTMRFVYDILHLNFAAIFTSSHTLSDALYHLASRPEFLVPLREEIEWVVAKDGWSKASMQKMRKVDSFLRETLRFRGFNPLAMGRKVLKDYKLSDGTVLPKGTSVAVNSYAVHHNNEIFERPEEFQPFRFSNIRDQSLEESTRNQMVATASDYIAFGHGKHACPGRFFAANELKAMLAYVVLNYDLKLPDGEQKKITYESDLRGPIMFRKRQENGK
ncbi:cytochrome P450 [Pyrrhoderma noxium]|uniref:Cytochrome P450 n=1 Tax=Pyrrhoderma noxium TaxID=2282107 RepID=A0A286U792_9AGAM|nr:cytochrome P450 [Pyrrhoderma noxium]